METHRTLLVFGAMLYLAAAPAEVSAIRCYVCGWPHQALDYSSPFDCKNGNTLHRYVTTCDDSSGTQECYTKVHKDDRVTFIQRGCYPTSICQDSDTTSCCTDDLCNGKNYEEPSVIDCYDCDTAYTTSKICEDPSAASNTDSVIVGCPKGYKCEMERSYRSEDNYTEPSNVRRRCTSLCISYVSDPTNDSDLKTQTECCDQDLCNGRNMFVDGASNMSYTLSALVMMLILVSIM